MKIAFVTYKNEPGLTKDDKVLAHYLSQKDMVISPAVWDDANVNWQQFDAVVLRSTWDYFEKPDAFNKWLDKLASLNCNVLNPVSVIRWNQNKKYFIDFSKKGILLPPYRICFRNGHISLKKIMEDNNWCKAVVKPAISGGSYNTWVTTSATVSTDEIRFTEMLQSGDVIIQKFVDEIITNGELSLIFINKKFSHAICKKARENDFRVQTQFGGTAEPIQPGKNILKIATDILNEISEPLLYARVDGIETNEGEFLLMELELIEPVLFVAANDNACENFYNALQQLLTANSAV